MLLINTKEKQIINIADKMWVEVEAITVDTNQVRVNIQFNESDIEERVLNIGSSLQLMPRVILTPIRIVIGKEVQITLGFDAPRDIEISGTWKSKVKTNLTCLTTRDLVSLGKEVSTTALEKELTKRLARMI